MFFISLQRKESLISTSNTYVIAAACNEIFALVSIKEAYNTLSKFIEKNIGRVMYVYYAMVSYHICRAFL